MSGSPKYTTARLSAEREAQLERERQAREAERRRREEEEKRRQLQTRAEQQRPRVRALTTRLEALRQRAGQAGVMLRLDPLRARLEASDRALGAVSAPADLDRQRREMDAVEAELTKMESTVVATIAREERRGALRALQQQVAGVDPALARRFDAAGGAALQAEMQALETALQAEQLAEFDRRRASAAAAAARHAGEVAARHAQWTAARDAARAAADELGRQVRDVMREARAAGMAAAETAAVEGQVAELGRACDQERFDDVLARQAEVRTAVDGARARVEAWVEARTRREMVLAAVAEALPGLGFTVEPRSLQTGADTALRAYRAGGGSVDVAVGDDGQGQPEIYYHVDGMEFDPPPPGEPGVQSCDQVETLLEALHDTLRGQGIEVDELRWAGKPDTRRPPKHAVDHRTVRTQGAG